MEENKKKGKGIGVVIFLLIIAILACGGLGYYVYYIGDVHKAEMASANGTISDLTSEKDRLTEQLKKVKEEGKEEKKEETKQESVYVNTPEYEYVKKFISSMNSDIIGKIPDFDDVRSLDSKYISMALWNNLDSYYGVGVQDCYSLKIDTKYLNELMVKLFGERANGLIDNADFELGFPFEKNEDGKTYHWGGFDGPEGGGINYIIDSVSKNGNKYSVKLLNYKWQSDHNNPEVDMTKSEYQYEERFYDLKGTLITSITVTVIKGDDITPGSIRCFDRNGNELTIKDGDTFSYIEEKYKNKFTSQELELEFDKDHFILLSSKTAE